MNWCPVSSSCFRAQLLYEWERDRLREREREKKERVAERELWRNEVEGRDLKTKLEFERAERREADLFRYHCELCLCVAVRFIPHPYLWCSSFSQDSTTQQDILFLTHYELCRQVEDLRAALGAECELRASLSKTKDECEVFLERFVNQITCRPGSINFWSLGLTDIQHWSALRKSSTFFRCKTDLDTERQAGLVAQQKLSDYEVFMETMRDEREGVMRRCFALEAAVSHIAQAFFLGHFCRGCTMWRQ